MWNEEQGRRQDRTKFGQTTKVEAQMVRDEIWGLGNAAATATRTRTRDRIGLVRWISGIGVQKVWSGTFFLKLPRGLGTLGRRVDRDFF